MKRVNFVAYLLIGAFLFKVWNEHLMTIAYQGQRAALERIAAADERAHPAGNPITTITYGFNTSHLTTLGGTAVAR